MARSRALAWACGLDWPTLLVWTPLGSATVLRHHHRRCRTRHTHHCRCSWVRPGAASSQPVLVLGGSLRKPRVLGLLFLDVRPTNEMRATLTGGASLFTPTGSSAWNGMQATRFGRTSLQPRAANVSHRLGMCECRVGASVARPRPHGSEHKAATLWSCRRLHATYPPTDQVPNARHTY